MSVQHEWHTWSTCLNSFLKGAIFNPKLTVVQCFNIRTAQSFAYNCVKVSLELDISDCFYIFLCACVYLLVHVMWFGPRTAKVSNKLVLHFVWNCRSNNLKQVYRSSESTAKMYAGRIGASHWWVTLSISPMGQTTDGRTPDRRLITLSAVDAANVKSSRVRGRLHIRCALLRCASKKTRSVLPAQRTCERHHWTILSYYLVQQCIAQQRIATRSAGTRSVHVRVTAHKK